jgi:hypothetical protein
MALAVLVWLGACAPPPTATARVRTPPVTTAPAARSPAPRAPPDPDLHRPPPRRLLAIDWANVALASEGDAAALWRAIAPTGADWEDKLLEIPAPAARPLAVALLRGGTFSCSMPASPDCARPVFDVAPPAAGAGFDDPCLRRLLGLWALAQLEPEDIPGVKDALLAIAAIAPPESELVAAALAALPADDQALQLAVFARAWAAGQRELVDAALGNLDEAHLILAVQRHHIAGALSILSPEAHRAVFLAAIRDEQLAPEARTMAITDTASTVDRDLALAPDLQAALLAAVKSRDCSVAAMAARVLDQHGEHRFLPRRPRAASPVQLMRAMCVLASYENLQQADEASLLASYLPPRGLERVAISYDPLSEVDLDGDGDPHTVHTLDLVPRSEAVLAELPDLIRAMQHCTGSICVSDDHEFHFVWSRAAASGGELVLTRIEIAERPPCTPRSPTNPP